MTSNNGYDSFDHRIDIGGNNIMHGPNDSMNYQHHVENQNHMINNQVYQHESHSKPSSSQGFSPNPNLNVTPYTPAVPS